jgi:murein endopeptidase
MARRISPALLARVESRLWDAHDENAKAAGFQVTRTGRWQRRYRHPRIAIALAAAAARAADDEIRTTGAGGISRPSLGRAA